LGATFRHTRDANGDPPFDMAYWKIHWKDEWEGERAELLWSRLERRWPALARR
jgi:hypothetical protein